MAVALLLPPLKVNTRRVAGSYRIASGLRPVTFSDPVVASVRRSKMVTDESRPLLVKPFPSPGARAIPCTPGVAGMSPATASRRRSTTITCVPRDMNTRCPGPSTVR
jgi:hypothetical protein